MEPTRGDRRLEGVSASGSGEIDRSLPPPPQQKGENPPFRAIAVAAVLVLVLPIAAWHKIGYQTVDEGLPYRYHSLKAPNWLNELPYPIGLVAVIVVLGALGWLIAEYWVLSWRKWWFVVLGALCLMGAFTAWGGRYGTAGIGQVNQEGPDWPNIVGWAFLLSAPAVFGALFIVAGIALLKIFPPRANAFQQPKRLKSKLLLVALSLVPGCLVICAVILWKVFTAPSLQILSEGILALVAFLVIYAAIISPFMLLFMACVAACLIFLWLLLFRSADLVLRRKSYW